MSQQQGEDSLIGEGVISLAVDHSNMGGEGGRGCSNSADCFLGKKLLLLRFLFAAAHPHAGRRKQSSTGIAIGAGLDDCNLRLQQG